MQRPSRQKSGVVVAEARTFPSDIAQRLTGTDFRLLDELSFLSRLQRKRTGASYAMPSRRYLAEKIGCSIRTVSRSVARLKRLGILEAVQRRPRRGVWRSNLYRIRSWIGWRLGQLSGALRKIGSHRGTRTAHIAFSKRKIETSEEQSPPQNDLGTSILARWRDRGLVPVA